MKGGSGEEFLLIDLYSWSNEISKLKNQQYFVRKHLSQCRTLRTNHKIFIFRSNCDEVYGFCVYLPILDVFSLQM